jgi:hypothetical protein
MLHNKPLYVALAQRREVRRIQLQARFSQPMSTLSRPGGAFVGGYPTIYHAPNHGVVPHIVQRQGIIYPNLGLRPGWSSSGDLALSQRPAFQPPLAVVRFHLLNWISVINLVYFYLSCCDSDFLCSFECVFHRLEIILANKGNRGYTRMD